MNNQEKRFFLGNSYRGLCCLLYVVLALLHPSPPAQARPQTGQRDPGAGAEAVVSSPGLMQ